MKSVSIIIFLSLFVFNSYSQEISYGVLVNTNYYDVAVKNGNQIGGEVTDPPFGIGVFYDYNFSKNLGFKTNVLFTSAKERYYIYGSNSNNEFDINKKTLLITPHLKYDVANGYNRGFYLISGPSFTYVLSAKNNTDNQIKDFYNKLNLGIQLGFGFNFLKYLGFEVVGDYGLNDITKSDQVVKTAGIHGNLTINLESILNK